MVKKSVLILVSLFWASICFAQVGPGGYTPRPCINLTDGSNTVSCASKITVTGGTVGGANPNGTLTISSGSGNIGIGTVNLVSEYIGVGTLGPTSSLYVIGNNVGIGSITPGQVLDVQGTIRTTGFILPKNASSGYILTSNSVGIGTWMPSSSGSSSNWSNSGTDVTLSGGNVGIGTTLTTTSALTVMNGNVGIGTWVPKGLLQVNGSTQNFNIVSNGNVGIGTYGPVSTLQVLGAATLTAPTITNMLTNPTFVGATGSTPPNGWTVFFFGTGSLSLSGSTLTITCGNNDVYIYQAVTTVIGTTYTVSAIWSANDGNSQALLRVGNSANSTSLLNMSLANGANGTTSGNFVATATTTYLTLYNSESVANTHVAVTSPVFQLTTAAPQELNVFGGTSIGATYGAIASPVSGLIVEGNVGIGSIAPGQALDVLGVIRSSTLTASKPVFTDASKNIISGTTGSGSEQTISYQPGLLTAVNSTIGVYSKFNNASTVDNLIGSAVTFSCVSNPTITMYECGTSVTCASTPVTIGTVTVTASGTATVGTVSNPAITAGDYVGFAITAGTCASIDIAATSQIHSN